MECGHVVSNYIISAADKPVVGCSCVVRIRPRSTCYVVGIDGRVNVRMEGSTDSLKESKLFEDNFAGSLKRWA